MFSLDQIYFENLHQDITICIIINSLLILEQKRNEPNHKKDWYKSNCNILANSKK